MNKRVIALILIVVGLVLFIDEIWMFVPWLGSPGWLIGDWSWMHVEPFHHWMLGAGMVFTGGLMIK